MALGEEEERRRRGKRRRRSLSVCLSSRSAWSVCVPRKGGRPRAAERLFLDLASFGRAGLSVAWLPAERDSDAHSRPGIKMMMSSYAQRFRRAKQRERRKKNWFDLIKYLTNWSRDFEQETNKQTDELGFEKHLKN